MRKLPNKNIKLLFLKKENKKEIPIKIKKQEIERNVTKSSLYRSYRKDSSLLKNLNFSFQNDIKQIYNSRSCNKTLNNSNYKLKTKYLNILRAESHKKLKYLNNTTLDNIFSNKIIYDPKINLTITPTTKLNIDFSNNIEKNNSNNKLKLQKLLLEREHSITKENHLNEQNKYHYFTKLLKKSIMGIKNVSLKKYSLAGRLALKVVDKLDVIEEHGNFKKYENPDKKFAKFKLLLYEQKVKNYNLIKEMNETRIKNQHILNDYIIRIKKKNKI
jgi:hypothetical protein